MSDTYVNGKKVLVAGTVVHDSSHGPLEIEVPGFRFELRFKTGPQMKVNYPSGTSIELEGFENEMGALAGIPNGLTISGIQHHLNLMVFTSKSGDLRTIHYSIYPA